MSAILLSIKPEYAHKILEGTKKFEFRRKIPAKVIDKIIIYSTAPECKVIGEASINGIIKKAPTPLWEETKNFAGISRTAYRKYFHGCQVAYAFCIKEVTVYQQVKELSDFGISYSPQSFIYIKKG